MFAAAGRTLPSDLPAEEQDVNSSTVAVVLHEAFRDHSVSFRVRSVSIPCPFRAVQDYCPCGKVGIPSAPPKGNQSSSSAAWAAASQTSDMCRHAGVCAGRRRSGSCQQSCDSDICPSLQGCSRGPQQRTRPPPLWRCSGGRAPCASAPALPSRRQRRRQLNTLPTPARTEHYPLPSDPGMVISLGNPPLLAFEAMPCVADRRSM
jgi:hypothetical protein